MKDIIYKINESTIEDIVEHLNLCDLDFIPKLSSKVNIVDYSIKLFEKANRFEAWKKNKLVGLVALYYNFEENLGFITSVSVLHEYNGNGIAKKLFEFVIAQIKELKFKKLLLEVNKSNYGAIKLYEHFNFKICKETEDNYLLKINIK